MKTKKAELRLVEVHGKETLLTSSIVISENLDRENKAIVALAKKYLPDLLEVGHVRFETRMVIRKQGGGLPQEIALFDDYAAMLLLTHMRSIGKVREFKKRLVQEFKRMRKMLSDPDRKQAIQYKRDTARPMTDMLKFLRETAGKKTKGVPHCSNEHKLAHWALTGTYAPLDESSLDAYDAKLSGEIRQYNTHLMTRFLKQADRRPLLTKFVNDYRAKTPRQYRLKETRVLYSA